MILSLCFIDLSLICDGLRFRFTHPTVCRFLKKYDGNAHFNYAMTVGATCWSPSVRITINFFLHIDLGDRRSPLQRFTGSIFVKETACDIDYPFK